MDLRTLTLSKKFRKALDNESRNLTFRGKEMDLGILYKMWIWSGDADTVRT